MIEQLLARMLAAWRAFFAPVSIPARWEDDEERPFANVREFHPARRRS